MNKNIIHSQAFDEQFMSYSTFCVHRGGNIIDSPRNRASKVNDCMAVS